MSTTAAFIPMHWKSPGDSDRERHIKNGDSPIFARLVTELGDPFSNSAPPAKKDTLSISDEVSERFAALDKMTKMELWQFCQEHQDSDPSIALPSKKWSRKNMLEVAQKLLRAEY